MEQEKASRFEKVDGGGEFQNAERGDAENSFHSWGQKRSFDLISEGCDADEWVLSSP